MEEELEFAKRLALEAGAIMRANFALGMKKEWKKDSTPLTATDLAINKLVLDAVATSYPAHSFIGEEGSDIKTSEYTWVCDPIDGTIPFSHGFPTFVFSLALVKNGESLLGMIYDPTVDRLLTATKGGGAYLNGKQVKVSGEKELKKSTYVEIGGYSELPALQRIVGERGAQVLTFYSCVYAGMLVAAGELVGQVYKYKNPWDAAAIKIIVEEAGGKVTDLDGNEQRYDGDINGFIASNGLVHGELIECVRRARES